MRSDYRPHSAESLMAEAIDTLHAPDDLAERILAAEQSGPAKRSRRGRARSLAAVIAMALAGTLALGGAGYAVATSDFVAQAFGSHGLGSSNTWSVTGDDKDATAYSFTREFDTASEGSASDALAAAAEPVGYTVEAGGYTLAIESMALDANGAGAVTFTLSNQDGIKLADDYGAGANELVFDYETSDVRAVQMFFADGSFPDYRCYYDTANSNATEIHGTLYFSGTIAGNGNAEAFASGVRWKLAGKDFAAETDVFTPSKVVETKTFSSEGVTANLSPLSILMSFPQTSERGAEPVMPYLAFELADGTTQVIKDSTNTTENIMNTYVGCLYFGDESSQLAYVLSQLADPDKVTAISISEQRYEVVTSEDGSTALGSPKGELSSYALTPSE